MKKNHITFSSVTILLMLFFLNLNLTAQVNDKPRTIVTTDGEVDDMDSFIRMLLYSNDLDLIGLVYSSSQWHYSGDGKGTTFISEMPMTKKIYGERTELRWPGTTWMQELIDKYAMVYPNLLQHDQAYPAPEYLKSIIRIGNIEFEGEMEKNTEGSEYIKSILLDNDNRPVYIQAWGGTNTLARALKSIEEEYKGSPGWKNIYKKVSSGIFIYIILDQDATYKKYIEPNWPEIRVIYNTRQFWSFAYMWPTVVPEGQKKYLKGEWLSKNIKFDHGALLENYYLWGDGQQIKGDPEHTHGSMEETKKKNMDQYDFISEGDSPAYLFLLNFGLQNYEDPAYGGLGGRFKKSETNIFRWEDGQNVADYNPETDKYGPTYPQVRWIEALQKDFAARADWCVQTYENANHAPVLTGGKSLIQASKGETVKLSGEATDPDNDMLTYRWWNYQEAGTYPLQVTVDKPNENPAYLEVPQKAKQGQTIHMILEVTDSGEPSLTQFKRIVIQIK